MLWEKIPPATGQIDVASPRAREGHATSVFFRVAAMGRGRETAGVVYDRRSAPRWPRGAGIGRVVVMRQRPTVANVGRQGGRGAFRPTDKAYEIMKLAESGDGNQ